MIARACLLASLGAFSAPASGCALLTKSDPVLPRYFSPEVFDTASPAVPNAHLDLSVRLGRIGGGSYLKERIAFRNSDHEFGFYEDRRWTERPEVYLQRAIERSLFEERGVKRALVPSAPTLTADLIEFEEVRGPAPRVRLRVSYALFDEHTVLIERSVAVERPLAPGTEASRADRVAAGLGDALREVVARMADDVISDLASRERSPKGA
jgi:cholesterol transport system auxiliary component